MVTEIQLSFDLNKLLEKPIVPFMTPTEFASHVGVCKKTIVALMDSDQIPALHLSASGKGDRRTRYVNLVQLFRQCDSEHFVNSVNSSIQTEERGAIQ